MNEYLDKIQNAVEESFASKIQNCQKRNFIQKYKISIVYCNLNLDFIQDSDCKYSVILSFSTTNLYIRNKIMKFIQIKYKRELH